MAEVILVSLLAVVLAGLCLLLGYRVLFMVTMLHGPVYVPSSAERLSTMLALPKISKKTKILDLGSGDGTILLAVAQQFDAQLEGVEINPLLVHRSKQRIAKAGLSGRITINRKNFWDVDLSKYDLVFLYGTSYIMRKLEKKATQEMRSGTQFVSNYFKFPTRKPTLTKNDVHLYQF